LNTIRFCGPEDNATLYVILLYVPLCVTVSAARYVV